MLYNRVTNKDNKEVDQNKIAMQHRAKLGNLFCVMFYKQLENDMQAVHQIVLSLNTVSKDWF